MSSALLQLSEQAQIATITLNRPEQMNALNRALLDALLATLDDLAPRRDLRALVFTGAGDRAFCAGADLKERAGLTPAETRAFLLRIRRVMDFVERMPMPTIAALNGVAFGGGCELALACDLRVMAEQTQMGLTECALGIIPGAGGTQRLPRLVGPAVAKELIFTARRVGAADALRLGLVNHVVPPGEALSRALALGGEIARCAPLAVEAAKAAIDGGLESGISEGMLLEQRAYEVTLYTEDRREALTAFREKRSPVFHGR